MPEDKKEILFAELDVAKEELFEVMEAIVQGTCRTEALVHAENVLEALRKLEKGLKG